MVTILLEQIIEILKGWLSSFTSWAEDTAEKLGLIEEATEYIDDIYDETTQIQTNTSSIVTSNNMIQSYSLNISNKTNNIDSNVTAIKNNVGSIATSAGTAAAFSEDIATNTLNTLDKVTTIASDTTQMRANTNNIYSDVDEIKTLLRYFSAGLIMEEDSEGPIAICDTDLTDYLINCKCGFSTTKVNNTLVGVDKVNITRCGVNVCGGSKLLANAQAYLTTGTTDTENKTFSFSSTASTTSGLSFTSGINFKSNTAYTLILTAKKSSGTGTNIRFQYTDGTSDNLGDISGTDKQTKVYTSNASKTLKSIIKYTGSGITTLYYDETGVFEGTLTATDFEPYNGTTALINLGSTYYGGELDALNGRLKVTHDYIASYNGESINEPWISSLDDYVPNTSPTTGAEVVYPLTSPYYVAVNNITIRTLKGINNIYNDCDNTFVTYKETVKHYLEKQEA